MRLDLYHRNNLLILGAGASKDYGLPIWKELDSSIRNKLKGAVANQYSRSKDVLAWLDKVGESANHEYKTIDECIARESVTGIYHADGDSVENDLFLSMKGIFEEVYKDNNAGWLKILNDKILYQPNNELEKKMAFISYNYDNILEKNFLKFDYLPGKHFRLNHKPRLDQLTSVRVPVLYAHGNLYVKSELPTNFHTERHYETMKSGNAGYIDVVSCYESYNHEINHEFYADELNLYILGLGGGLEFNLGKLNIGKKVSQIFVTISDKRNDEPVIKFLSAKFKLPAEKISVYRTCTDLVEKCL